MHLAIISETSRNAWNKGVCASNSPASARNTTNSQTFLMNSWQHVTRGKWEENAMTEGKSEKRHCHCYLSAVHVADLSEGKRAFDSLSNVKLTDQLGNIVYGKHQTVLERVRIQVVGKIGNERED